MRIRFCPTGKIAYMRKEDAKRVIREQREIPAQYHREGHSQVSYYPCKKCGFYHTTSQTGSPERGNRIPD